MSPKVPEAYLEARRNEILEAAYKCFSEKGFHNATMQDIYNTANLSPGAVYNYFSSKEDIAVATVKKLNDLVMPQLASLSSQSPEKSFEDMINYWLSHLKQDYIGNSISIQLDYFSEATRNGKIRRALLESQATTHALLIEIIKRNQQTGFIYPELDPLSIARAVMGLFFGIGIHKLLDPDIDVEAFSKVFKAMLIGTFSTPPKKRVKTVKTKSTRCPA
jgi:AcrR family transcriptional regulator